MKFRSSMAAAVTTLLLVACTEGGDVYVNEPGKSQASSSAALECTIVPGANMCDRRLDSVEPAERGRVLDALQAVSDFAGVTESMANELASACRGIVTETSATLPPFPTASTPEEQLHIVCVAARDAIVASERSVLRIDVTPAKCTAAAPRTCSAPAALASTPCEPPTVDVSTADGAGAVSATVGLALSHHYGTLMAAKGRLETLASLTTRLTGKADALALLPGECVVSSAKLAADSTARVQAFTEAIGLVLDAVSSISR